MISDVYYWVAPWRSKASACDEHFVAVVTTSGGPGASSPDVDHSLAVDVALNYRLPTVTSVLGPGDQATTDQDAEDEDDEGGKNNKKDEVHQRVRSLLKLNSNGLV